MPDIDPDPGPIEASWEYGTGLWRWECLACQTTSEKTYPFVDAAIAAGETDHECANA